MFADGRLMIRSNEALASVCAEVGHISCPKNAYLDSASEGTAQVPISAGAVHEHISAGAIQVHERGGLCMFLMQTTA